MDVGKFSPLSPAPQRGREKGFQLKSFWLVHIQICYLHGLKGEAKAIVGKAIRTIIVKAEFISVWFL